MKNQNQIAKIFNIRTGEEKTVLPLLLYSVFMGIAYAFLFTTATSLFLADFKTKSLPIAYMAGGGLGYILWLVYNRIESKFLFSKRLIFGGIFLLITISILAIAYNITRLPLFSFLLFTWINVFVFVNGVGYWGIAGKLFNLQQGKRLFGLISSGEVFAKVIGFFSVPFILPYLENQEILYISVFGLIGCLFILTRITKKFSSQLDSKGIKKLTATDKQNSSFRQTIQHKYYRYILILAVFPLFGAYFIDYVFLDQTKAQFNNPELVSGFLGVFFGFMSVAEFIIKTFISGRLISKYGILFTLMVLPVMLFITTFWASAYSTILGVTTLFFTFIGLNKLAVRVLRTSFLDPAFQILYQPISREDRQSLQGKVEGISKSVGNFLAGGLLLLLAHASFFTVVHFHYILLLIVGLWIWVSYLLYKEYRAHLTTTLAKIKETESHQNTSALVSYFSWCDLNNPSQFTKAMQLIQKLAPGVVNYMLVRVLPKASPEIQLLILKIISRKNILPANKIIKYCLSNNLTNQQEDDFLAVLQYLTLTSKIPVAELNRMANEQEITQRLQAAEIVGYSANYFTHNLVQILIKDSDSRVRNIVLQSRGKKTRRDLWPAILKNLSEPDSFYGAALAIKAIGEPIVASLIEYFNKDTTSKSTQIRILNILAETGGARATRFLWEKTYLFDDKIKNSILSGLMNQHFKVASLQLPQVKQAIEKDINLLVWVAACLLDVEELHEAGYLKQALQTELHQKQENVFLQLSLLYDANTIGYFIKNFKNASDENRAYALEVLDLTISPDLKILILPLLNDLSPEDILKSYEINFLQQKLTYAERLQDIINKDYRRIHKYTKACALELTINFPEITRTVAANFLNSEPLIQETTLWAYSKLDAATLEEKIHRLPIADSIKLGSVINQFDILNERHFLRLQVVRLVQKLDLFKAISVFDLVNLCQEAKQLYLPAYQEYKLGIKHQENIFIPLKGEIIVRSPFSEEEVFTTGDIFWNLDSNLNSGILFIPNTNTVLLEINSNYMLELFAQNLQLATAFLQQISVKKNNLEWAV